jgi:N-acetylglutamate synthase-like GNAT family acetyltransferase
MKALQRLVKRLTASILGRRDDDRVREELAEHLTLLTEELARGCHSTKGSFVKKGES